MVYTKLAILLAALCVLVPVSTSNVAIAAESESGGWCYATGTVNGYWYPDTYGGYASFTLGNSWKNSWQDCANDAQALAIETGANVCYYNLGISGGQYGVGYASPGWWFFWNGQYQTTLNQQYDCGDISW